MDSATKPPLPILDSEADQELIGILSTEVARDGGTAPGIFIKDYLARPKHLDRLLVRCIGSKKLLAYCETHPDVFRVDRSGSIHLLSLVEWPLLFPIPTVSVEAASALKDALAEKFVRVLTKRAAKLRRRNREDDRLRCSIYWLINESRMEVHFWLRQTGFYVDAYSKNDTAFAMVGSREWVDFVYNYVVSEVVLQYPDKFQSPESSCLICLNENVVQPISPVEVAQKMKEVLLDEGATHMNLSLLVHRYPGLKHLLRGEDIMAIIKTNADLFEEFEIEHIGNSEYQIRLKTAPQGIDQGKEGRMLVDEQGLYSVASSRWSNAMASILVDCCRKEYGKTSIEAVDLTASVGGMTLGLAKTRFFYRVLAVEIDMERARLCALNMERHNVHDMVQVCKQDAMAAIKNFSAEADRQMVFVLDPPWGGMNYRFRSQKETSINMGSWSLEDIFVAISKHYAVETTLVALRVPVGYDVEALCCRLDRPSDGSYRIVSIRKLGPQLFAILKGEP